MDAFNSISLVVGVVGTGVGIAGLARAEHFNKRRRRLQWSDLQSAANDLGRRILRDISPVAIVTPGLTGATFANLLADELRGQLPVYVGTRTWREESATSPTRGDNLLITTKKWFVTIPRAVTLHDEGTILVVDDFVMSGDFLELLKSTLQTEGVSADRIRSAAIVTTQVADRNHKAPDYWWIMTDSDDFYFPWGKAR